MFLQRLEMKKYQILRRAPHTEKFVFVAFAGLSEEEAINVAKDYKNKNPSNEYRVLEIQSKERVAFCTEVD